MLHPGIGGHYEVAGKQRAESYAESGDPIQSPAHASTAEQKQAEKAGFQEEGIDSLQWQSLSEDASTETRKAAPVGTEFKLQRNPCHDSEREIDRENLSPEVGRISIAVVSSLQFQ